MKALMRPIARAALGVVLVLLCASGAQAQELVFSVAISMREAVQELGQSFAAARPGVTLRYNLGSSGELQKQIEAGAPVDVFISAAARQMDELEAKKLVLSDTRRAFARNVLTVIKPADSRIDITKPADLGEARVGRIVIGNPKTVPAGQYAEEIAAGPRALGPRAGEAGLRRERPTGAGLRCPRRGGRGLRLHHRRHRAEDGVKEAFRPGEDTYRPVVYPAAVVSGTKQSALARAFVELLSSAEARTVLARLGFQPPLPGDALRGTPGA